MMRLVAVAAAVGALLVGIGAQAEKQSEQQPDKRLFFVVNADGYGVDHCLSSSTACGTTVANAYCHAHEYAQALSFRKVEPGDSSGAITANRPADASCSGRGCGEFVAIECSR